MSKDSANRVNLALSLVEDFDLTYDEALQAVIEVDKASMKKLLQKGMKASLAKIKDKGKREKQKANMLKSMDIVLGWMQS